MSIGSSNGLRDAVSAVISHADSQVGASIVNQWMRERDDAHEKYLTFDNFAAICDIVRRQQGEATLQQWAQGVAKLQRPKPVDAPSPSSMPYSVSRHSNVSASPATRSPSRDSVTRSPFRRSSSIGGHSSATTPARGPVNQHTSVRQFHEAWKQRVASASRCLTSLRLQERLRYDALAELTITLKSGMSKLKTHALVAGDSFCTTTGKLIPLLLFQLESEDRTIVGHVISLIGLILDVLGELYKEYAVDTLRKCLMVVRSTELSTVASQVFTCMRVLIDIVRMPNLIAVILAHLMEYKGKPTSNALMEFCGSSVDYLLAHVVRTHLLNVRYMIDDQLYPGTYTLPIVWRGMSYEDQIVTSASEIIKFVRADLSAKHGIEPSKVDLLDAHYAQEIDDNHPLEPPNHPLESAAQLAMHLGVEILEKNEPQGREASVSTTGNTVAATLSNLVPTDGLEHTAGPGDERIFLSSKPLDHFFNNMWELLLVPLHTSGTIASRLYTSVYLFFPAHLSAKLELCDIKLAREAVRCMQSQMSGYNFISVTKGFLSPVLGDGDDTPPQVDSLLLHETGGGVDAPFEHRQRRARMSRVSIETPRRAVSPKSVSGSSVGGAYQQPALSKGRQYKSTSSSTVMVFSTPTTGVNDGRSRSVGTRSETMSIGSTLLGTVRRAPTRR